MDQNNDTQNIYLKHSYPSLYIYIFIIIINNNVRDHSMHVNSQFQDYIQCLSQLNNTFIS